MALAGCKPLADGVTDKSLKRMTYQLDLYGDWSKNLAGFDKRLKAKIRQLKATQYYAVNLILTFNGGFKSMTPQQVFELIQTIALQDPQLGAMEVDFYVYY